MTTHTMGNAGPSSLGEFLADSGPSSAKPADIRSTEQRFSAALRKAAEDSSTWEASVAARRTVVAPLRSVSESLASPAPVEAESGGSQREWISKDAWAENNLLTGELTAATLQRVVDPAELLNARLAAVQEPTDAKVVDADGGAAQAVNASGLSTLAQAQQIMQRLTDLGIGVGEVVDLTLGGPYRIDYGADQRRNFVIDGHNVGHLIERYAKYPVEVADRMTRDEFKKS